MKRDYSNLFNRYFAIFLGCLVLVLDAATKMWTHRLLPEISSRFFHYPYGGIGIFKDFYGVEFSIVHAINHGAAWGILSGYQKPLLVFRILLISALFIYAVFFNKRKKLWIPFALILSGAFANIIDYFIYGHVIDMFYFVFWGYSYPVFNVADSAIFLGILWVFLSTNSAEEKS